MIHRGSVFIDRLSAEGLLAGEPPSEFGAIEVAGLATDSRHVAPDFLFCAVRGVAGDGHRFLADAATAGAAAALVEEPTAAVDIPQVIVTSGRKAAAFAAAAFYGDPWEDVALIGITGTNGKTTTAAILRHILAGREAAASLGTLGVVGPDGRTIPGTEGLTTPGPVQFAEELGRLTDLGVQAVAMEVSSHALDQDRVIAGRFAGAVFTNLSRDHLDYHADLESYRRAKLKLADLVRPKGVIAANIDDPAWEGVEREGVHLVRFGTQGRGEVQAEGITYRNGGIEWHLSTPSCSTEVHLPLFGSYNVYNALGAAAVLWGLGWTSDQIAERLRSLPQVPGRLERVGATTGPAILIDFAHTPDALARALAALRPLVKGRLIVVFGAGGDRDRGKRPEMGRVAAEMADFSVVTTDNPRHEDPRGIADEIEAAMGDSPRLRILDRRAAIARAIELATPDDLILLAGKGHETYQIWGDDHRPLDERRIVQEVLQRRGGH
ncbi:MAG: UDP-N-acetylmuramoyl-L-alanyl-D-glutamate--2,6-diaminopimelate ligase [Gemmatimonas sp.]|nr:UDP-N-acetylmuramoyl-L-alanyl-D-glutamate--2,6-diaminopimelate ligase [Gemmatimonas sp.]